MPGAAEILPFRALQNPTRGSVEFAWVVTLPPGATLDVFDVQGRLRSVLVDETRDAGAHRVAWAGQDSRGRRCGPGVYFCRIEVGRQTLTRKIVLLQ